MTGVAHAVINFAFPFPPVRPVGGSKTGFDLLKPHPQIA